MLLRVYSKINKLFPKLYLATLLLISQLRLATKSIQTSSAQTLLQQADHHWQGDIAQSLSIKPLTFLLRVKLKQALSQKG